MVDPSYTVHSLALAPAGFECDYSLFPSAEAQDLFLRHYMADPSTNLQQPADVNHDMLRRLRAEANAFALASHMYWGVWALIQAR